MNPKEAANELKKKAIEIKIRFPKIWDEKKILQTCGATILLHRKDGSFDFDAAIQSLEEIYGQEESSEVNEDSPKKRKKSKDDNESDQSPSKEKIKKPKKTETITNEQNRKAAEAIKEMADIYFKNKDMRKGGVFSKAAKAIRECEFFISDKKEAMKLKGVGKGIASYIEELLETGMIEKLEELRAGTA